MDLIDTKEASYLSLPHVGIGEYSSKWQMFRDERIGFGIYFPPGYKAESRKDGMFNSLSLLHPDGIHLTRANWVDFPEALSSTYGLCKDSEGQDLLENTEERPIFGTITEVYGELTLPLKTWKNATYKSNQDIFGYGLCVQGSSLNNYPSVNSIAMFIESNSPDKEMVLAKQID